MREGLWGIVSGAELQPDEGELRVKFREKQEKALGTLILSVSPQLHYVLGNPLPACPNALWVTLERKFQRKTWANISEKRKKLHSLHMKEGESVEEHMRTLTELMDQLSVIDTPIKLEERSMYLIESLPPSMDTLVTAMSGSVDVPDWDTIAEKLRTEESKQRSRGADLKQEEEALLLKKLAKGRGKKGAIPGKHFHSGIKCYKCGKRGHYKSDCPQTDTPERYGGLMQEGSSGDEDEDLLLCHALAASPHLADMWVVDSGATSHMCKNKNLIKDYKDLHQVQVKVGDGGTLGAIGTGTVTLKVRLPSGESHTCKLQKVLHIPGLAFNLLSVPSLTEAGKSTVFHKTHCKVSEGTRTVARGSRSGGLYILDLDTDHAALASYETWHRRFAHLGSQNLQRLQTGKMVTGLEKMRKDETEVCKPCLAGRHAKNPFPTSSGRASHPLDLVHSDVCGKLGTKSLGGAEYFVSFIDSASHYAWTFPIQKKGDVFRIFQKWKARAETETGRKLKVLRTDGGGEYTSTEFGRYLEKAGVKHELTIPRTPEQNGVAERLNRTLMESVRSLLADSGLSKEFWGEALSTATYLRNLSPSRVIDNLTPAQAWTGRKPDVSNLRVFGCKAFAHVPAELRGKLDAKTHKCRMMGYARKSKAYRLFDEEKRKIFFSRNVVFQEETPREQPEETADVKLEETDESDKPDKESPVVAPGRPTRVTRKPDKYGEWANLIVQTCPSSYAEAMSQEDAKEWEEAMSREMGSLKKHQVWDLTSLPTGKKVVGNRWVYKRKLGPNGEVVRHKARLVAQGFTQQHGTDYDQTFSPVIRMESVRMMAAIATQRSMEIHQVDIATAFLNGILNEEVYMRQPRGFEIGNQDIVCKLKKSLYGLKQSPRCWNIALDTQLREMGFTQSKADPCIYLSDKEALHIGVYVDDILLTGDLSRIQEVKHQLGEQFEVKDLGKLNYFLGINVETAAEGKEMWMGQPTYVEQLLDAQKMSSCKAVGTPVDPGGHLTSATEEEETVTQQLYQSLIGSLLYLATCTRPDIAFAVGMLAKFSSKPTSRHWTAAKRVLRYLQGTRNYGIQFCQQEEPDCRGYSDADWAGDREDRRSTSGYIFQLCSGPISWRSKKQTTVALSTAEAEYVALSSAAQEAVWLRRLSTEMGSLPSSPTMILEDNQSAIAMSKNPQFHGRAKHIDIRHHFVRELVEEETIELMYCPTEDMVADLLTKGLSTARTKRMRELMGVHPRPTNEIEKNEVEEEY